jgi:hypothetical protein
MVETVVIHCPYCGEGFETVVDLSAGSQSYTEDCAVCCRPIEIALSVDEEGNLADIRTRTDRE